MSYTIFRTLQFGTWPLVVLNSGPGLSHPYMLPHVELHKMHCRPTILYDQLTTGDSIHLYNKPADFSSQRSPSQSWITSCGISDIVLLEQSLGDARHRVYHSAPAQRLKHLVLTDGAASYPLLRVAVADLRKYCHRTTTLRPVSARGL